MNAQYINAKNEKVLVKCQEQEEKTRIQNKDN